MREAELRAKNSYLSDAWGQTRSQTGSIANPFTYTAREAGEAGFNFYRARYYSPGIGRFTQEDLARFRAGINFYAYVRSSPARNTDPSGLYTLDGSCRCIMGPVSPETCSNDTLGNCWSPVLGTLIQKAFHNAPCRKAFADNGVDWGAFAGQLMPTSPFPIVTCDQSYCGKGGSGEYYSVQRVIPLCRKQFNLDYETAASTAFHEFLHGVGVGDGTSQQANIMHACFPGHMQ